MKYDLYKYLCENYENIIDYSKSCKLQPHEKYFDEQDCEYINDYTGFTLVVSDKHILDSLYKYCINLRIMRIEFKNFNGKIPVGCIPDFITHIIFNSPNLRLMPGAIPNSVRHIILNSVQLMPGTIPNSVTHIVFGYSFNQILYEDIIPNSVTHLVFGHCFNRTLKPGIIPSSVTHLYFGHDFNQSLKIGDIPEGVKTLSLGYNFNKKLNEGCIPTSVTHLVLSRMFNNIIKPGVLCCNLKVIRFGHCFNQPLKYCVIPHGVTHLFFGNGFTGNALKNSFIPQSIEFLKFGDNLNMSLLIDRLPQSLIDITMGEKNIIHSSSIHPKTFKKINIGYYSFKNNERIIGYSNNNLYIPIHKKYTLDKFIIENMSDDKLIGRVIYNELVNKVFEFNKNRMLIE